MSLSADNASMRGTKRESNDGNVRVFTEMRTDFCLAMIDPACNVGTVAAVRYVRAIFADLKPEINEITGIRRSQNKYCQKQAGRGRRSQCQPSA
jgi:hypothetical protein